MSKSKEDEIPPFLDRRLNGRCRAYWAAMKKCPPSRNAHEYAMQHYEKLVPRMRLVDEKEGPPRCLPPRPEPTRTRAPTRPKTRVRQRQPAVRTRQPVKAIRQRTIPT